ncbi:MAG: adenosine kinase [Alphaproteobacteria bacterium]
MTKGELDVLGVGNAIVDVFAHADDDVLRRHGLPKGVMTLIDAERAVDLYGAMGPGIEMSGGSCGNTIAGLASLGARCAYVGRVRDDQLGEIFRHDVRSLGVEFDTPPATEGKPTARCLVYVTPDAQRTMATFLGVCTELNEADIDEAQVARAKVTYLEGYLWDDPRAKAALLKAAGAAHGAGRRLAFTLSDPFCVDRHRDEFRDLIARHVDILFANEAEICSLYRVEAFEDALARVGADCEVAVLTRSEKGSVVVTRGAVHRVPAEPVDRVVDTTGAGDLFAAGFLYGYTHGRGPEESARIGGICAAEVIAHVGARPETNLAELVRARLG